MAALSLGQPANPLGSKGLFTAPTSVILLGSDRSLLNWVAYALASVTDPEFIWTDVRLPGQLLAESDPLSRDLIPAGRMHVMHPDDLAMNNASANVAVSLVIRSDEPPDNVRRLLAFLRLPTQAQDILSRSRPDGQLRAVVLSNGQRMLGVFPSISTVNQTIHAIVDAGVVAIITIADAPGEGRFAFENILHVEGSDPKRWREAILRVERGSAAGPFQTGSQDRLADVEPVATVLAEGLG